MSVLDNSFAYGSKSVAQKLHITGELVSVESGTIDIVVLYRLLKIVHEKPGISLKALFEEYRNRTGVKVNYNTVKRHIDYAVEKGLVEKRGSRPAALYVTKKGVDYLFLVSQVARLLDEDIG